MIERRRIVDPRDWQSWRAENINASEIAAVFGLHPYLTPLELWADKSGVDMGRNDSGPLRRGRIMEPSVAAAVALERPEWRLEKCTDYFVDKRARLGATPDFWIHGDPRGLGVLQAKTVAEGQKKKWEEDEQAPFWITLQNVQELMLTEVAFGATAALFIGYNLDVKIYETPRHAPAEKRIRDGAREFWKHIESGQQPPADLDRDAAVLAALYPHEHEGLSVDLSGDNFLPVELQRRADLKARIKADEEAVERIENDVRVKLGHAETGFAKGWRITWKAQTRKATYQPESTSRVLRVSKLKESP